MNESRFIGIQPSVDERTPGVMEEFLFPSTLYLSNAMVGMARRAVPARVVAGGTNIRTTVATGGVAPLHAARTSQRDVRAMSLPKRYSVEREKRPPSLGHVPDGVCQASVR